MKVSVVIPAYEYNGKGVYYLSHILRSISTQTLKDVEVIIPDHSIDDNIKKFCDDNIFNLNIVYKNNIATRGNVSDNKNLGMDLATGEIVKMMYMDDYFYCNNALEKIYLTLKESDKMWLVCGTNHTRTDGRSYENNFYPRWNDNMLKSRGNNTMSGVSVIAYKNQNMTVRWDINTCMLMDIDFYYSMREKYGDCVYLNEILISQRINADSLTETLSDEQVEKEFKYCRKKHNIIV